MGMIKGSMLVICSILLVIFLFLAGTSKTIDLSLEKDLVKGTLVSEANNSLQGFDSILEQIYSQMVIDCESNSHLLIGNSTQNRTIYCEDVSLGTEKIMERLIEEQINSQYDKEYDCNFFDCVKDGNQGAFLSNHAREYWNGKFWTFLVLSLICLGLIIFLLTEKYYSGVFLSGVLFVVSSIPLRSMEWIAVLLGGKWIDTVSTFVNIYFSKSYILFWTYIIIAFLLFSISITIIVVSRITGIGVPATKSDVKKMVEAAIKGKKKEKKKSKKGEIVLEE
jgi:hypothetical protein